MSAPIIVRTESGLQGERFPDGQVRVLDLHVAETLGYARARDIRKLIRKVVEEGLLTGILVRARKARGRNQHGETGAEVEANEYWLTVREALFIASQSDTAKAKLGTLRLIDEYLALQKLVEKLIVDQASVIGIAKGMLERLLRPAGNHEPWRECFEEAFVADLCKLYRQPYAGRRDAEGKPLPDPRFLGSVQKKIYQIVVGADAHREMKRLADDAGVRLHQTLQADPNAYFRSQLEIVHTIVNQSASVSDFWHRMVRQYRGGALQMLLPAPPT